MRCRSAVLLFLILSFLSGCRMRQDGATTPDTGVASVPTVAATQPQTYPTICDDTQPIQAQETSTPATEVEPLIQPIPEDGDLVRVRDYIPDILVELPYGTVENFTGKVIYDFSDAWLRYGTVKKLALVQDELRDKGLFLKIWDGYRPKSAQQKLWEVCPDPAFVSDPSKGSNSHCRGIAVDLTLVDSNGNELIMPTGFDDFSSLADRDYGDCAPEAASNAQYLEDLMSEYGFKPYSKEWWHFSDTQEYPIIEDFEPLEPVWCFVVCDEFISLRAAADTGADVITRISAGGEMLALARSGDFLLVEYLGVQGYVLESYTRAL